MYFFLVACVVGLLFYWVSFDRYVVVYFIGLVMVAFSLVMLVWRWVEIVVLIVHELMSVFWFV